MIKHNEPKPVIKGPRHLNLLRLLATCILLFAAVWGNAQDKSPAETGTSNTFLTTLSEQERALDSIPAPEPHAIYRKWLSLHDPSASDYTRLWPVAAIFVVVLIGLGTWNWKLAAEIRHLKQAETALQASEQERHRTILQTALEGIWRADMQGRLIEVNDAYCRMSGYSEQELRGMHISDLEANELPTDTAARIQKIRMQGQDSFESRHRRKDGSLFNVEISVRYLNINGGSLVSFLHDITLRKQAETYREMGMEILALLNESDPFPDTIQRVITTLKTRTGVDAAGIRLQDGDDFPYFAQDGFSADFLLAENTLQARDATGGVCRDKDGNACLECSCGLVISGKTDPANPLFTRGGSFWINDSFSLLDLPADQDPRHHPRNTCIHQGYASVALVPIRVKNRIVGLIHFNERRKGFFSLETVELLESIAAHIGSDLMRKQAEVERNQMLAQLVQSQKLESIGTLAGGVAHEINNPIMGIMCYAQLIIDQLGPDSPVADFATEIGRETERVAMIVRNLLMFARSEKQENSPARLCDIVESTLSLIRALVRHDQIILEVDVPEDLPTIRCRSQQIQQVMTNLLTNARDALNERYPQLDADKKVLLTARPIEKDGLPWIRLTVEDHGLGIPEGVRTLIFDPFFTTKPHDKSTGLGLSISHGIIKAHGGELSFESKIGQWTRFHMDLPVPEKREGDAINHG